MGSFSLTLLPNFFDLTSVTKFLLFDRIYGRNLMNSYLEVHTNINAKSIFRRQWYVSKSEFPALLSKGRIMRTRLHTSRQNKF